MARKSSNAKSSASKLRVAMIGAGGIAGTHMAELSKMSDVELVAIADVNEKALSAKADEYKIPRTFTDYRKMLAEVKPDAVSVCTPNGLHCQPTIDALRSGAHVMVEKPLAMNAREGQAMLDAAKKSKRKLVIGFQWRYDPRAQFLRSAVAEGRFGKVLYARCQALRRRGIPNWGVFGRKELQGGGPLIDIGVHIMEVAHFTMGSPRPVAATGQTFTYIGNRKSDVVSMWPNWDYKTYTVEDLAVGQIRFDNGAVMTVESSFAGHLQDTFNFQIMGEKAGGNFDPPTLYTDAHGHMINATPAYLPTADFKGVFTKKMRNWVDHVLYDKPSASPGSDGLMIQKMLDAIYESAAKGREVSIR